MADKTAPEDLMQEIARLREVEQYHEQFVVACTELVPEGYDGDDSAEEIVLQYLRDMDRFAGIIARITSAYR